MEQNTRLHVPINFATSIVPVALCCERIGIAREHFTSMRKFKKLGTDLHERFQLTMITGSASASVSTFANTWRPMDEQLGLAQTHETGHPDKTRALFVVWEERCMGNSDTLKEVVDARSLETRSAYLVKRDDRDIGFGYPESNLSGLMQRVRSISVPTSLEGLCDKHSPEPERPCDIVGELSKHVCSGVTEIYIPDSAECLCDKCFYENGSFSRVVFGGSSSLKLVLCKGR